MAKRSDRHQNPTVYSIAEACGVSATTVSLALRDDPRLREETRQRIKAYAQRVHYRPNPVACSLKRSRTGYIGLIMPSPTWWVDTLMLDELYRQAAIQGYDLQLNLTHDDLQQEAKALSRCLQGSVDGLILFASFEQEKELPRDYPLAELRRRQLPCVLVGVNPSDFVRIRRDRAQAVELATRHLADQGYERLCLLLAVRSMTLLNSRWRVDRFRQTLEGLGRPTTEKDVYHHLSGFERLKTAADKPETRLFFDYQLHGRYGYEMARDVLAETPATQRVGLVCGSDAIAAGAYRYCREQGLDVPGRVGIVGCDDTVSHDLDVTTCRWNHQKMCSQMLESLQAQMAGPVKPEVMLQEPALVVRSSSVPSPAGGRVIP